MYGQQTRLHICKSTLGPHKFFGGPHAARGPQFGHAWSRISYCCRFIKLRPADWFCLGSWDWYYGRYYYIKAKQTLNRITQDKKTFWYLIILRHQFILTNQGKFLKTITYLGLIFVKSLPWLVIETHG